jgi:hypothetical protein
MEVIGSAGPQTAGEIERALDESDDFTCVSVVFDGQRWVRSKVVMPDMPSWVMAEDLFWVQMQEAGFDATCVKLAAVIQENVAMVDEMQYGDEPGFDPDELDRYAHDPRPLRWYTVFAVWRCNSPDFVRTVLPVQAINACHAQLIVREHRQEGEFYVCGVADLRVPTLDNDVFGRYATPGGEPATPIREEPEPRRRWWQPGH